MIPWYHSKTVWANVLTGLVLFLALPELAAVLPEAALRFIPLALAGLNIALRVVSIADIRTPARTAERDGHPDGV